jgi:hypothetical protein
MGGGQVVNTQRYVFYFESDTAKVFPFRPTYSSYDYEGGKKSKSEPKRTRKESEQMWQTWNNSIGGNFKEIFCDIYLELPLFNTTKPYEM